MAKNVSNCQNVPNAPGQFETFWSFETFLVIWNGHFETFCQFETFQMTNSKTTPNFEKVMDVFKM